MWDVACWTLKTSIELFFFPFLFSGYVYSVDPRVVSFVPDGCNQCSSTLSYVVFKSLYWCMNAIFNAGKSSPSFFSWHEESVNVISGVQSLIQENISSLVSPSLSCSIVFFFNSSQGPGTYLFVFFQFNSAVNPFVLLWTTSRINPFYKVLYLFL